MSRRTLKSDDEAGFLMATYDDLAETAQLYRVELKVVIKPSGVRGRFRMEAQAWKDVGKPAERCVATWSGEYPTAQAMRFHAALYRAAVGIGAACGRAGLPYRGEDSEDTVA